MKTEDSTPNKIVGSWYFLNEHIYEFSREELESALALEIAGEARWSYLSRILGRICRLDRIARFEQLKDMVDPRNHGRGFRPPAFISNVEAD